MNLFSLKPHPLVAHWVPGFVVCLVLTLGRFDWSFQTLAIALSGGSTAATSPSSVPEASASGATATISILVVTILAFVVGEIIDAIRNIREDDRVRWDFFFWCKEQELTNMEESYFTWYAFDANMALGLVLAVGLLVLGKLLCMVPCHWNSLCEVAVVLLISSYVLHRDAKSLRKEIADLTHAWCDKNGIKATIKPENEKSPDKQR